jgi:beta-glucanase (GH16 family)
MPRLLCAVSLGLALPCLAAWAPVYFDHFSSPTLDPTLWTVRDNMTHGDLEWQLYLKDEVYVENGAMVIRTRARNASYGSKPYRFTSGWVDTRGSARGENTYGMFSARIQLPLELSGVWPAFWLVDDNNHCWPRGGEIDILEAVGTTTNDAVFGTYHWGSSCGADGWSKDHRKGIFPRPAREPFSAGFHNFTSYWNATHITWEVDGQPYVSRVAGQPAGLFVPSWPLYTIFNTALSFWGSEPQPPPTVGYPVFMRVDWVGAWRWDGPGGDAGQFPIPYNGTGLQPNGAAGAVSPVASGASA